MSTTTAPDPRTGGMVSIMVMYRPPGAPAPTGAPGKTSSDQPPTYDSIFLGEQVPSTFIFFLEENFSVSPVQEQPPGYNMVRVDVANMEQQAQEAEGAQARSVIPSITQTYYALHCRPLVAEASASEGGELLGRQQQDDVEVDRIEGATPLVRLEAGQEKDCGLV